MTFPVKAATPCEAKIQNWNSLANQTAGQTTLKDVSATPS